MDILDIRSLRGPNYWSNSRTQLILMTLDLKHYEYLPSNKLEGFAQTLQQLMPSLYNHYCSEGTKGGFITRLEEGTWLGHVIEHVALELQWLAGMECGFGRTRSTHEKGVYHVVFAYEIEDAGFYAAHAAVNIVRQLAQQKPYLLLADDLTQLKQIHANKRLGPSTSSIVQEAKKRDIPCTRLDDDSLIMLGHGAHQKLICATTTCQTNIIGVDNASDKEKTKKLLSSAHIPIPKGLIIETVDQLDYVLSEIKYPWVIKPSDGNHGRGVTTNITTKEKAVMAFNLAKQVSSRVIVEKFIKGSDYRFLVINYKVIAVAKRTPAMIIGTGNHTILQLIDLTNQNPLRGENHEKCLSIIKIDELTLSILSEHGFSLDTVLPTGQVLYLKHAANLSTGGTATDVTNLVHQNTVFLAERIARITHLDICGIDILAENITQPLTEKTGAVIEVNSNPGFRMHLSPEQGEARNVAKPVIDMLFPENKPSRIPLVAVTGTNGKTTTVRLIARLAKEAGFSVGFTSTEGIYINDQEICRGDCSGPSSANVILRDPIVNFAVLECARGGILRSGLGFDKCTISIVTNISEDHLGLDDIHTLDAMARVKEVVPLSTSKDGYAILNADDDLVYQLKASLSCHVALFSMHHQNKRIHQHCQQGGMVAFVKDEHIVIKKGNTETFLDKVSAFPLSFCGKATCMIQNLLPAVLAGVISGFKTNDIARSLRHFYPSAENLPGRMNVYVFNKINVMVDYVHNEAGFIQLKHYLSQVNFTKKTGIIAATGDRKPSDIRNIARYAAEIFDEIIIRHDKDGRGKNNEELSQLLLEGIKKANTLKPENIKIISDEVAAFEYAIENALPGGFILYFPEDVLTATAYLKNRQSQKTRILVSSV